MRANHYGVVGITFLDAEPPPPLQKKTNWGLSLSPLKKMERKWALLKAFTKSGNAHASKRAVETSLEKSGEDLKLWEFTIRPIPPIGQELGKWGVYGRYIPPPFEEKEEML